VDGLAALCAALVAALTALYRMPRGLRPSPCVFSCRCRADWVRPFSSAMAPDGRQLAFVATDVAGRQQLGTRTWNVREPQLLPGNRRCAHPFWSPDSRAVGLSPVFANSSLKTRRSRAGRANDRVRRCSSRASWSQDDTILFVQRGVVARVCLERPRLLHVVGE